MNQVYGRVMNPPIYLNRDIGYIRLRACGKDTVHRAYVPVLRGRALKEAIIWRET